MSYKNIHDICSFMSTDDNETYLSGTDENGEEITLVFNTIELLEWLNVPYMKKITLKYIKSP